MMGWQIVWILPIIVCLTSAVPIDKNQPTDSTDGGDNGNIAIIPRVYFINATIPTNITHRNLTEEEIYWMIRNRQRENELERTRDNWLEVLKAKILRHLGRSNMSMLPTVRADQQFHTLNLTTVLPNFLNVTQNINSDDYITEKIRSYYPSCEIPLNTDEDSWKDDNIMNLYFNFQQLSDDRGLNIATATLRLYRLPNQNASNSATKSTDCGDNTSLIDEDRLLRVSIYWYTKSLKKRRVKRRLSDSKVIADSARWVELSVKPATRAWTRGRNLGLAVLVEDQEGNILRADRYFKGASCMVGMSTPKPIPTIIMDRIREINNKPNNIYSIFGRNATPSITSDIFMLPIIDICTLEFPENYTSPLYHSNNNNNNNNNGQYFHNLRINACNLNKLHDQNQYQMEKERLERLALLPDLLQQQQNLRHIRHQRQHHHSSNNNNNNNNDEFDPRSRITNKRLLTMEELQNLNLDNLTMSRVDR